MPLAERLPSAATASCQVSPLFRWVLPELAPHSSTRPPPPESVLQTSASDLNATLIAFKSLQWRPPWGLGAMTLMTWAHAPQHTTLGGIIPPHWLFQALPGCGPALAGWSCLASVPAPTSRALFPRVAVSALTHTCSLGPADPPFSRAFQTSQDLIERGSQCPGIDSSLCMLPAGSSSSQWPPRASGQWSPVLPAQRRAEPPLVK